MAEQNQHFTNEPQQYKDIANEARTFVVEPSEQQEALAAAEKKLHDLSNAHHERQSLDRQAISIS